MYAGFQAWTDAMAPLRSAAGVFVRQRDSMGSLAQSPFASHLLAYLDVMGGARITHDRPAFGIDKVLVGNRESRSARK